MDESDQIGSNVIDIADWIVKSKEDSGTNQKIRHQIEKNGNNVTYILDFVAKRAQLEKTIDTYNTQVLAQLSKDYE